jgi:hypothetical protein
MAEGWKTGVSLLIFQLLKERFSRNITDILPLENVSTPTLLFPKASKNNGAHARNSDVGATLASLILK